MPVLRNDYYKYTYLLLSLLTTLSAALSSPSTHLNNLKMSNENGKPLMTFGVIADIQYAPIPDGTSYGGQPRYYRHALTVARHAATHFQEENVSLVVNLGDIIDGKCQEIEKHRREELDDYNPPNNGADPGHDAIDDVVTALSVYKGRILNTYGNHELYNLNREDIGSKLNIPMHHSNEPDGELVGYYFHSSPCNTVRFVVLDSYDVAIMQRCPNSSIKRQKAMKILAENNPNYPDQENSPEGMEGVQKRFVAFNGAVDEPQMDWLRSTLEEAKSEGQKAIILSHQPILPDSSSPVCLIWNYDEVLAILREYKCTVAAAFAGHAHRGGYKRDEESGIHFRVFEAALESNDPVKTYGFVDVHDDRLEVRGEGDCISAIYDLDHLSTHNAIEKGPKL